MKLLDKDIREPLFEFLEEHYGKTRIIEEKSLGDARADAVMVRPSELIGIEIKSDGDTYARLKNQIKTYDRFFDGNIIVVGSSHALHAADHVPEYWGIISVEAGEMQEKAAGGSAEREAEAEAGAESEAAADPGAESEAVADSGAESEAGRNPGAESEAETSPVPVFDFYIIREYKKNPLMEMTDKIKILWRPELARIQEKYGMYAYKSASKDFVRRKITDTIPEEFLNAEISDTLFERDYTKIAEEINAFRRAKGRRPKRKKPKKKKLRLI